MKTRNVALLLAAIILLFTGCGANENADHTEMHDEHSEEPSAVGELTDSENTLSLSLNGEERWEMDDHTRQMFAKMVARFDEATLASPASLGADLKSDLGELIAGCTMDGAAHDELHKYLEVLIPAIDGLVADSGPEKATVVNELLTVYPEYFK